MTTPFFIVGFQRSGTTLLRVMLDAHPEIAIPLDVVGLWWKVRRELDGADHVGPESARRALVERIVRDERIELWNTPLSVDDLLTDWTTGALPDLVDAVYRRYAEHRGKRMWGDKDPGNMTQIPLLNRWFPGCRFIHIIRDGRGACLSHLGQSFGHSDLMECAESWREEVSWVRQMGDLLGAERFHEVRYEMLVKEPEPVLRDVCAFLGVPYRTEMLRYTEGISANIPESKRHIWPLIGEAPRADNADAWRASMPEATQVCFEKRAGTVLRDLGYETSPPPWSGRYATELRFVLARIVRRIIHRNRQ